MVKYIKSDKQIPKISRNVSCIGYFDGVHLGHQKLINKTLSLAKKKKLIPTLICFDPNPNDIIKNNKNKYLLNFKERITLISQLGIKQIIVIKFDKKLMNLNEETFIKKYLNKFNIDTLICGYDFSFGYKGKGKASALKKQKTFETIVVPEHTYLNKKVSTTRVKEALSKGNLRLVNKLLGWDYYLIVSVQKCSKTGKNWLIEAKNTQNNKEMPKDGKYGEIFEIKGNKVYILGKSKLKKGQKLLINFS